MHKFIYYFLVLLLILYTFLVFMFFWYLCFIGIILYTFLVFLMNKNFSTLDTTTGRLLVRGVTMTLVLDDAKKRKNR